MRIVWVAHSDRISWGADLSLREAVKGLITAGHEIYVIAPAPGELADLMAGMGATVAVIPHYADWVYSGFTPNLYYRIRRMLSNLRRARLLSKFFSQVQPELVVSNTLGSPAAALASKWVRIPHVWYIHELFGKDCHDQVFFDLGQPISLYLIKKLSCRVIVNSIAVQNKFKSRIPIEKLQLVHYAVEVPRRSPKTREADNLFRLIIVGRITPGKRQEDAIQAVAILANQGLSVHLSILGNQNTEYGNFLRRLAKQLGIESRVAFIDFTLDPHSFVSEANVALMCSRGEPFGRVTVEAMKLGKPVIGAIGAGTSELIQHGVNGFLYPLGDIEGLAQCVETLYYDRRLLKQMGDNAREWSNSTFTLKEYTSSLLKVFEKAQTDSNSSAPRMFAKPMRDESVPILRSSK